MCRLVYIQDYTPHLTSETCKCTVPMRSTVSSGESLFFIDIRFFFVSGPGVPTTCVNACVSAIGSALCAAFCSARPLPRPRPRRLLSTPLPRSLPRPVRAAAFYYCLYIPPSRCAALCYTLFHIRCSFLPMLRSRLRGCVLACVGAWVRAFVHLCVHVCMCVFIGACTPGPLPQPLPRPLPRPLRTAAFDSVPRLPLHYARCAVLFQVCVRA